MAVFSHFDTDPNGWEYYYTYHAHPFRSTLGTPVAQNRQAVQIGRNPNSKSSHLDLSGFIIRPQRFNSIAGDRRGWVQTDPLGDDIAAGEINAWNNGHWPAYAITPQHVVVNGHFVAGDPDPSMNPPPFSFEGPWPWNSNTEKKLLFMNPDGEYKVHDYEFVNIDLARDGNNEHLGGGDAILLELTEPIAEDSGIKIYNKSYVLDNDQQFAVFTSLDSNGRTYQTIYNGFQSDIGIFGGSAQFRWAPSSIPLLVEERKLPGGDLENETMRYAGTQNTPPAPHEGDSGTPRFAHSRSRGTITVMGPGGTKGDQVGPWAKERVEKFQQYLQTFNEENGTNYTFDYEVITDAITDIKVPPLIDPLVCKTQEGMLSRKLVCEVTATGTNGQVITKRSESLLEQGIIEPVVFSSVQGLFVRSGGSQSESITLDIASTVFVPIIFSGVDPLSPVEEATCTISDSIGNEIVVDVLSESNDWWSRGRDSEEFTLPSGTWQVGDVEVTYSVTTQNGTTTISKTMQIIEPIEIPSVDLDSVQLTIINDPDNDPETEDAQLRVSFSYTLPQNVLAVNFFIITGNKEQGTGNIVGGVQCAAACNEGAAFGLTTRAAIPCSLSEGQDLYLVGWFNTTDAQHHKYGTGEVIDPLTENLNVVQTSEAILLVDNIISGEHCLP